MGSDVEPYQECLVQLLEVIDVYEQCLTFNEIPDNLHRFTLPRIRAARQLLEPYEIEQERRRPGVEANRKGKRRPVKGARDGS